MTQVLHPLFFLQSNPCQHPIVILRDVSEQDLQALLQFMYNGQVQVPDEQLKNFLRTAETLQIRGLTDEAPSKGQLSNANEDQGKAFLKREVL